MARGHADAASARQDLHRRGAWLGGGSGRRALRPERPGRVRRDGKVLLRGASRRFRDDVGDREDAAGAGRHGQRAQAGVAGPDDRWPRGASHRTCGGGLRRRRARGGRASTRGRGAEGSAARDRGPEVAAGRRARHAFGGAAGFRGPGELPAHPHRGPSGGQARFRCEAPAILQRPVSARGVVDFRVRFPTGVRPAVNLPAEYVDRYDAVLGLEERWDMSLDALVAEMDVAGVSHAVVHAEYEYGDPADDLNEAVAALVAKMPDRFSGYGTVSLAPLRVMRAAAQVTRSAQLGLRGINIQPSFFGMPIDHPQLYPVYAKACELGLGVGVHTGINYTSHLPGGMRFSRAHAHRVPRRLAMGSRVGGCRPQASQRVPGVRRPGAEVRWRRRDRMGGGLPFHEQPAFGAGAVRHRLAGVPYGEGARRMARP